MNVTGCVRNRKPVLCLHVKCLGITHKVYIPLEEVAEYDNKYKGMGLAWLKDVRKRW